MATLNPGDLMVEDELGLLTDCMIASFVALEVRLYEALARVYGVNPPIQIMSILKRDGAGGGSIQGRPWPDGGQTPPLRTPMCAANATTVVAETAGSAACTSVESVP